MKKIIFISLIIICNSFSTFALPGYPAKEDSTKQTKTVKKENLLATNTINLEQTIDSLQYVPGKVNIGLGIQIRGGIKFPESSSYSFATKYGFYGGISFIIPLSYSIDLQPEINYSNSPSENIANNNISTKEIAIMLGYKYYLENFTIKLISGLGIISTSGDSYSPSNEKLLALSLGIGINKKIYSRIYASFELRKQWSASFNTGGGNSFNPFILNLGIMYIIPKTTNQ